MIGVNTTVDPFYFEDGVCRKWVVTYTFMNWCDNNCARFRQDWVFKDVIAPVIECTTPNLPAAGELYDRNNAFEISD
ncbi:MAG: hypothetical protein IPL55_04815 [Saprospiraceae bacterium]|nr:hypothetical protein [Saprospiraceae bacterium]